MKALIIYVLSLLLIVSVLAWVSYPDYARRGQVVQVGNSTWGFLLFEEKAFVPHRAVTVLYLTTTGQWIEQSFPAELIRPIPIKQDRSAF